MTQAAQRPKPSMERPQAAAMARVRLPRPANDNRRRGRPVPLYGLAIAAVLVIAGLALLFA